MYRVIAFFTDLHDDDHPYNVGDPFPREGITVTDERIAELSGKDNKQGRPLIEEFRPLVMGIDMGIDGKVIG